MTADELRSLLAPYGIRPIRDRGQHFLLDERIVGRMADAAGIGPGSRAVEVGPGPGILTTELLGRGADVVAVELDPKLVSLLKDRFGNEPRLRLLQGDALSFSNRDLAAAFGPGQADWSVVANLPYAITSDALRKFLLEEPYPTSVTIMIQREVADRLLAPTGEMSAIAVMVRVFAEIGRVANVPAGAFFPPPKVDSAVIHIVRKDSRILADFFGSVAPDRFFSIVRAAFAGKRKQLKNSLRSLGLPENGLAEAFLKADIPPAARPEDLTVEEWRRLVFALTV